MFNVVIIGGEQTGDYDFFKEKCIKYLKNKAESGEGITIFTIGDEFVTRFAEQFRIDYKYFMPNWKKDKDKALIIRNNNLLEKANAVIAFHYGSPDVKFIVKGAELRNILIRNVKE